MNHGFVTVLPQTLPGASGQMVAKMLLQPNGRAVWLVAFGPGTGGFFAGPDRWNKVVPS